ncbi:CHRD domain-containing protein [Roseomonas marmotae]|uniref:CHRD domain-containing protein n=2 Tax=Roseomonas marmotae TaxID=2768161 RepID=A0ABS3KGS5_9PROT|nr:CHRD domain-containing protein [Roseomonas marmotae]QTI80775.1 CHRD domain-containing protein [Roseomonas marmotae]
MRAPALAAAAVAAMLAASASQAAPVFYSTDLSGAAENPPNASPASGTGLLGYDVAAHLMTIEIDFSGLLGQTTVAHIHCCVAPPNNTAPATTVPSFPGFPTGISSGSYSASFNTLDAGTWNPAFIAANGGTAAGAEAAFAAGLDAGFAYLNLHSNQFPAGEIRGYLTPVAVPEPATLGLFAGAIGLLALVRRRARD